MERRRDDPQYQMHEPKPPAGTDAPPDRQAPVGAGSSDRPDESFQEVNRRLNMGRRDPETVREEEREHDSSSAPESDTSA